MLRSLTLPAVLSSITLLWACGEPVEKPEAFDNVVLVTIDTLRADHVGSYGYPRPTTPFLDSLAQRGVRFERAVSPISVTTPSHASLFTSQYPARHRLLSNGMKMGEGIPDLASTLSRAGFETKAVMAIRFLKTAATGFESLSHRGRTGTWTATIVVNQALSWLEERDTARRFLLWVHFYDVHETRADDDPPPAEDLELMQSDSEMRGADLLEILRVEQGANLDAVPGGLELINRYDAQLAYVDREIRRLHSEISSSIPDEQTLWIVTSDHGEGLGSHDIVGHGEHLYDEQLHVPLIFVGGDSWEGGRVVSSPVQLVDLFPTISELVQVEIDLETLELEGESLVPLLTGASATARPRIAFAQRRPADDHMIERGFLDEIVLAAEDGRYKYVLHSQSQDELYDLVEDPLELENLIGQGLPDEDRLAGWLARKYQWMLENPLFGAIESPEVDPEHIEELKALGYLN